MPTADKDVYFDKMLQSWIKATAYRERWRVPSWYDVVDLIQDGVICYCKCRDRYTLGPPDPGHHPLHRVPGVDPYPSSDQRKHFMALVQRAYYNHIMTLAAKFAKAKEAPVDCSPIDDSSAVLEGLTAPQLEEASVLVALSNAPEEIGSAIRVLLNDGAEGEAFIRTKLRGKGDRVRRGRRLLRETTSEYYQRVTGVSDLLEKTEAYIYS